ncbi:exonuclease domain-containing protein [Nereida sp. MMG025]|uniref:exonuclease domain-containing protein n=1 Tax=Nereida sp. MMG025 TaxID=2909981 RepID=UPI001F25BB91|nr:exonuclease domain-containing protein [Nereida sp. MMG025]MCF6444221.1 3'-5' exonuclease [Nereida sp. MMG025]
MRSLSLRLRVFLFFVLIGLGGIAIDLAGLWLGYRQLGDAGALSAFVTSAVVSSFGFLALSVFIWLLFDENVSKPIEKLAARFRVGAHTDVTSELDDDATKYLGDLGPAARALQNKLHAAADDETVAQQIERLRRQRHQLLRILSDIPVAVLVANAQHQIVLYDGQAAEMLEREAPALLNGSVMDYLDAKAIADALVHLAKTQTKRMPITVQGHSGFSYEGHIRVFEQGLGYTLMLEPLSTEAARPLVYDFDLLDKSVPNHIGDAPLRDLCFVVFDSETTGLNPKTDRVVQLGAARVLNGKIVQGEVFDRLVNPMCPIPSHSTKVHGIDDQMVADAPTFAQISKEFHQFSSGAILVAHNAPFDMAFLHDAPDLSFDHPVLDTVHLSAIVFGGSEEHTLDALCKRMDIDIPPQLRHTALGDAMATAEVLVQLLPILEAKGLTTFNAIKMEMRKHSRILKVQD